MKNALQGIENKRRLQTLSIDNAWFNKNFLYYLTFRMLQHTSSEVIGYNCYKHLKMGSRGFLHFKALTQGCRASALADHVISTGHHLMKMLVARSYFFINFYW